MDLVFRREDRFYLVDWKSNHLGDAPDDYAPPALAGAMEAHGYILQYTLYTLALDRYLKSRLPGYSYEKNFGGVFYIFMRGVDAESGPGYGIYRDRPSEGLVELLGREMMKPAVSPASPAAAGRAGALT
jgi:exodeoxyribonuclease V beta subunit